MHSFVAFPHFPAKFRFLNQLTGIYVRNGAPALWIKFAGDVFHLKLIIIISVLGLDYAFEFAILKKQDRVCLFTRSLLAWRLLGPDGTTGPDSNKMLKPGFRAYISMLALWSMEIIDRNSLKWKLKEEKNHRKLKEEKNHSHS